MRTLLLLTLAACDGGDDDLPSGSGETGGLPLCSRVDGTTGILLYQDGGDTIRTPREAADPADRTTGVAGPLDEGELSYVSVANGRVLASADAGCTWDYVGSLPADGDWALLAGGPRVYAFDRSAARGARSDDGGASWTALTPTDVFAGLPTVDPANAERLRGVTATGQVVASGDGGSTWSPLGAIPLDSGTPRSAAVAAGDPDTVLVGTDVGAWLSRTGGASWERVFEGDVSSVAVSPDDAQVLFLVGPHTDGSLAVWRSGNGGGDWARLVDATQIALPAGMPLWPLPGSPTTVLAGTGIVNDDGNVALALYIVEEGVGTHTSSVETWDAMEQLVFGSDRWVAAVNAPAR